MSRTLKEMDLQKRKFKEEEICLYFRQLVLREHLSSHQIKELKVRGVQQL